MADAPQYFTDMFKRMGEQLKIPQFDMSKLMEHHQKNLDAMTRSWQAMASGATEIAKKQRALFEEAVKDVTEMAKDSVLRIKDLHFPAGVKPMADPEQIVATVKEVQELVVEPAAAEAGAAEPEVIGKGKEEVAE